MCDDQGFLIESCNVVSDRCLHVSWSHGITVSLYDFFTSKNVLFSMKQQALGRALRKLQRRF